MFKGTPELIAQRREEIICACEKLYKTMSFKEITLKEIGSELHSPDRLSIITSRQRKKYSLRYLNWSISAGTKTLRRYLRIRGRLQESR